MMDINLEALISKNLKQREFQKQLIQKNSVEEIFPTITVSRDPGSGGKTIAAKIARLLDIKMFDNELIDLVARKSNTRRQLIEAMDEKSQSNVTQIVNSLLGLESISSNMFIRNLATVVFSIATSQPAVILGRGMNFVLPKSTNLRIRITAPRRTLVKYAMKYEGHSATKARQIIDKYMKERHDFVYKYFSKDITKAHYYDLVINTETTGLDDAAKIAVYAFKCKFGL